MARIIFMAMWMLACAGNSMAQKPAGQFSGDILNAYVQQALSSNLALKQKEFSLQKSSAALNEAKGLFLPSMNIEARYSRAGGGRTIDFPVGDLMNPVYQSLNDILTGMGQSPRPFPQLENEQIPFLRKREHDTRLRVVQPVFQPKVYYNYKIKKYLEKIGQLDLQQFRRQLVADVRKAYYNYLKAGALHLFASETEKLLEENLRVTQKLFANQKITNDGVLRARAELSGVKLKRLQAENGEHLAAAYFNFLLNRPLQEPILKSEEPFGRPLAIVEKTYLERAKSRREELQKMKLAISISQSRKDLELSNYLPQINLAGDFGYQGADYQFDSAHDYWMVNGLLQWNLFHGFSDHARSQQAQIEGRSLQAALAELSQKIQLQVQQALYSYQSAYQQLLAAREQETSAAESFRLVKKQYALGVAPLIRFLDARNIMTGAGMERINAIYELKTKEADLVRVTAGE